ncbi:MAG: C4-dicarboxylate ABC transporter permease, partial [Magnetovibrio sp.]|nr:C4-dicarboxylate ABC transporter permease [Magnetovibrio sp.]
MHPRSPSGLRRLEAALLIPVEWAGRLAAACGLLMVFVVAGNVLTRYGFNLSSVALQELEWHLVSPIALIGMSYAMQKGEHVRVDFLY